MKQDEHAAAAAAVVEGELAVSNRAELRGRLRSCVARSVPGAQAGQSVAGLISDLARENGWTLAGHAGESGPARMRRLLNQAVWDEQEAMRRIRSFVVETLGDEESVRVASLDESGQKKQGSGTAGAQRHYMGCVDRVENGVNTVYCSYATPTGHARLGASVYLPRAQGAEDDHRAELGIPAGAEFQTKPQLARDLLTAMVADGTMPPWCAGDEVYGRSSELRGFCAEHGIGYVLRVGCTFRVELAPGLRMRADEAVAGWPPTIPGRCTRSPGPRVNAATAGPGSPPPARDTFC